MAKAAQTVLMDMAPLMIASDANRPQHLLLLPHSPFRLPRRAQYQAQLQQHLQLPLHEPHRRRCRKLVLIQRLLRGRRQELNRNLGRHLLLHPRLPQ